MNAVHRLLLAIPVFAAALLAGIHTGQQSRQDKQHDNAPVTTTHPAAVATLFASTLADTKGHPQALAQWQGRILVLNFWAPWCPPCRDEMPGFSRLQRKFSGNGVQFVGIALDTPESVNDFARTNPATYPLLTGESTAETLTRLFGNTRLALPYTAIIGADGIVRATRTGAVDETDLERLLRQETSR